MFRGKKYKESAKLLFHAVPLLDLYAVFHIIAQKGHQILSNHYPGFTKCFDMKYPKKYTPPAPSPMPVWYSAKAPAPDYFRCGPLP